MQRLHQRPLAILFEQKSHAISARTFPLFVTNVPLASDARVAGHGQGAGLVREQCNACTNVPLVGVASRASTDLEKNLLQKHE